MRWLFILALGACATATATTTPTDPSLSMRVFGKRPTAVLPEAIEAAQQHRFDVALVQGMPVRGFDPLLDDRERVSFVALPLDRALGADIRVAYIVNLLGTGNRPPRAVSIAVLPVGYRGDKPVADAELPPETHARAQELLTAIADRVRANRDVGPF